MIPSSLTAAEVRIKAEQVSRKFVPTLINQEDIATHDDSRIEQSEQGRE